MKHVEWNNGILEVHEYHDDGTVDVQMLEDSEPVIDQCKSMANSGIADNPKNLFWTFAKLTPVSVYQLLQRGVNVFNPNDMKKAEQLIEREYPYLKTTRKRLVIPKGSYSTRSGSVSSGLQPLSKAGS